MIRKLALGLVAAAAVSAAALAPTTASAGGGWGGGWGGGFHHHHHGFGFGFAPVYVGGGYGNDDCYQVRRVISPRGFVRWRTVNVCAY